MAIEEMDRPSPAANEVLIKVFAASVNPVDAMRFVVPKTHGQQASSMIFRTRDLSVRQRTQLINALRAHWAEHGVVAPQGIANLALLTQIIEDAQSGPESTCYGPEERLAATPFRWPLPRKYPCFNEASPGRWSKTFCSMSVSPQDSNRDGRRHEGVAGVIHRGPPFVRIDQNLLRQSM
ncbi:hypothetical protein FHT86_000956 [Rhizobium sp. BK313]|nr:hypothetical protein [Rhizobium sp. BK313]